MGYLKKIKFILKSFTWFIKNWQVEKTEHTYIEGFYTGFTVEIFICGYPCTTVKADHAEI